MSKISSDYFKNKKILVTGGEGFVGRYVVEKLVEHGAKSTDISIPRSKETDLRVYENCKKAVQGMDIVIHLAGKIGGIEFYKKYPGEAIYDNLIMGTQLIEAARLAGVSKFVTIGTASSYPGSAPIPLKEEELWNGYPEEIVAPYGLAKKMLLAQGQAYRKQYNFNSIHLIPTNLYGPKADFDRKSAQVLAALIMRVSDAKEQGKKEIEIWGTGKATRDFLYVEDAAEGIVLATEKYNEPEPVNLSVGKETSIKEMVGLICRLVDYHGEIKWDVSKPEGQLRRGLYAGRAKEKFGFVAKTDLETGLKKTIDWYLKNKNRL